MAGIAAWGRFRTSNTPSAGVIGKEPRLPSSNVAERFPGGSARCSWRVLRFSAVPRHRATSARKATSIISYIL